MTLEFTLPAHVPTQATPAGNGLSFFVAGVPIPKGSAKAFYNKALGRAQIMQDNHEKQKPWASMIGVTAQHAFDQEIRTGPVALSLMFVMPRPKSHFGTGRKSTVLRTTAPAYHISKPDLDKLIRCVKDALTGVVWKDDSQVCVISHAAKIYGEQPGVHIKVEQLGPDRGELQ